MNRFIALSCGALLSVSAFASNSSNNIAVEAYSDFVTIDMLADGYDMQVTVAGPNGYRNSTEYLSDQTVFLEIQDANGSSLADGLYHYDITPLPKVRWTREESTALRDSGKAPTAVESIAGSSGTFRILNGQIVTPHTDEASRAPDARIEK